MYRILLKATLPLAIVLLLAVVACGGEAPVEVTSITTTDHKKGTLSTSSCRPSTRLTALLTCFPRSGLRPKTDQIEEASL